MFSKSVLFIFVIIVFVQQIRSRSLTKLNSAVSNNRKKPPIEILKYTNVRKEDGYQFEYDSQDGTHREETGTFIEKNGKLVLHVKGSYSYIDPSGFYHVVGYGADDQGAKSSGDIIFRSLRTQNKEGATDNNSTSTTEMPSVPFAGSGLLNALSKGSGK